MVRIYVNYVQPREVRSPFVTPESWVCSLMQLFGCTQEADTKLFYVVPEVL
jgi:hypothetical protein